MISSRGNRKRTTIMNRQGVRKTPTEKCNRSENCLLKKKKKARRDRKKASDIKRKVQRAVSIGGFDFGEMVMMGD